jgi:hypothetical protein
VKPLTKRAIVAAAIGVCASAALAVPAWAAGSTSGSGSPAQPAAASQPAAATKTSAATAAKAAAAGKTTAAIKARAAAAISGRLAALHSAITALEANGVLTAGDKNTLLGILNEDVSGLSALGPRIQADTTVAQATSDYRSIFLNYRVYALALPQVRLAAATDDITGGVLPRLTDAQQKLSTVLSAGDPAKDTAVVKAEMSNLASQIQTVTSMTSGLSAKILAFTPAQYDANRTLLSATRQTLLTARADIAMARVDIQSVMAAIK